jgi:hypothetical protein
MDQLSDIMGGVVPHSLVMLCSTIVVAAFSGKVLILNRRGWPGGEPVVIGGEVVTVKVHTEPMCELQDLLGLVERQRMRPCG